MDTLGIPAKTRILKSQTHKLSQEFEVADSEAVAVYSASFVASNSITFVVNGVAITPVVYGSSHVLTVAALVAAIDGLSTVESATLDPLDINSRTIIVKPVINTATPTITSVVTSGASQATMSSNWYPSQLLPGTPVAIAPNGTIHAYRGAAEAGAYVGYSIKEAEAGELTTVVCSGFAVLKMEAGGTIVPGPVNFSTINTTTLYNEVTQATAWTSVTYGIALEAGVDGDVIQVLLTGL